MFQVYIPGGIPLNKTFICQINGIHGLPLVKYKITKDYFKYQEVLNFVRQLLEGDDVLVGYKGGTVEYELLRGINIRSSNIELLRVSKVRTAVV